MIRVCDAIMGSGKSRAAMTYMNENRDKKFVYITPYLAEASRINIGCPELHFVEPSDKIREFGYRKSSHTAAMLKAGRNVATTHQAFSKYTDDMLDDIRRQKYTLIIDESVDVAHQFAISQDDLRIAILSGLVNEQDGICSLGDDSYHGSLFCGLVNQLKERDLMRVGDGEVADMFYWELPIDLFTSFEDVYILTYMFDGQGLYHFLRIYDLEFERIGVMQDDSGVHRFCSYPGIPPAYTSSLSDRIYILDNAAVNRVGNGKTSLSVSWFQRGGPGVDQLRKSTYNYFHNIQSDARSGSIMWSTYNQYFNTLKGKGFSKCFVPFNTKATNQYRGRDCLAYLVNLFTPVGEKILYQMHGASVDDDKYALSIMVQWIWRSAIRDGKSVKLYVPSKRMRSLLCLWIDSVSKGVATL